MAAYAHRFRPGNLQKINDIGAHFGQGSMSTLPYVAFFPAIQP